MFGLLHNCYKYSKARKERRVTISIIGLDNAGKTSTLASINGEVATDVTPTWGFASEKIDVGRFQMTFFDLGGGASIRGIWNNYFAESHGAIFVVDAADADRFDEAKGALFEAVEEARLAGKPILIFANKQDVGGAASADDLAHKLHLEGLQSSSYRIVPCSAKPADGLVDPNMRKGVKWLTDSIEANYKALSERVAKESAEQKERERKEKEERKKRVEKQREERRRKREQEEAEAAAKAAAGGNEGAAGVGQAEPESKGAPDGAPAAPAAPAEPATATPDHEVKPTRAGTAW